VCHQAFGAIGITLEGPVFHISRRIRQLASLPPGAAPARAAVLSHFGLAGDSVGQASTRDSQQEAQTSA